MDSNATCYACDECGIPCELASLVPFKRQHICRICSGRLHAFTAPIEQVNAELRDAGIDPDEVTRRVADRLAEVGIVLKKETPSRDEVSEIEENETRTV